jgi:hypothetical protein
MALVALRDMSPRLSVDNKIHVIPRNTKPFCQRINTFSLLVQRSYQSYLFLCQFCLMVRLSLHAIFFRSSSYFFSKQRQMSPRFPMHNAMKRVAFHSKLRCQLAQAVSLGVQSTNHNNIPIFQLGLRRLLSFCRFSMVPTKQATSVHSVFGILGCCSWIDVSGITAWGKITPVKRPQSRRKWSPMKDLPCKPVSPYRTWLTIHRDGELPISCFFATGHPWPATEHTPGVMFTALHFFPETKRQGARITMAHRQPPVGCKAPMWYVRQPARETGVKTVMTPPTAAQYLSIPQVGVR